MILVAEISLKLNWLPATGAKSFAVSPWEAIRHALLPGIAIAAYGMAEVARQLRGSLLEVLSSQYVRTLHAKGLSMNRILWQHGLKNVAVNLFTIISVLVNRMLAATVVIEAVFAIPGMGSLIVRGAIQRDFPIVQGVVFAMVIVVILVNLIADLLCAAVDPRIEQ
jgi:peptide/nickel transport system permease protein